jgi:hypothetical protein
LRRLALLLALGACTKKAPEPAPPQPERFVGGIQVNEPDHLVWLTKLADAGFDTVELTVYATQEDWDSARLRLGGDERAVAAEMRLAKTLGLKVVLILRVALDHAYPRNRFLWHGMIHPRDDDLDAWFDRYGEFVDKWARIAAREGADVLGIASEMSALTNTQPVTTIPDLERYYLDPTEQARSHAAVIDSEELEPRHLAAAGAGDYVDAAAYLRDQSAAWREWAEITAHLGAPDPIAAINARRARLDKKWRALIERTRRSFPGKLTYAANFDQYAGVGFWDALDLIGVNAYFPLREGLDPTDRATLAKGWRRALDGIAAFRRTRKLERHPVLFTELGYRPCLGATSAPWASGVFDVLYLGGTPKLVLWPERPEAPDERAVAVHALADVAPDYEDFFAGVLYWKLSTQPGHTAIEPFVLVIDDTVADPMRPALLRFTADAKIGKVRE